MTHAAAKSTPLSNFDTSALEWLHFGPDPRFDYPIDYSIAILGTSPQSGTVDFISRWAPNSYCHYHRHLGNSMSLILEGEHHTVEVVDGEPIHKIRTAGDYANKPGGDVHMEYAGPEGTLVFFSMQAVDGNLFDVLGRGDKLLNTTSFEDFVAGNLPR